MARDATVTVFPFVPQGTTVTVDRPTFKGPKPLAGREQVVISGGGGWLITYDSIPLATTAIRDFRAYEAGVFAKGGYVYVRPEYGPYTLLKRNNVTTATNPTLAVAAAKNASSITITGGSLVLAAGDFFEINGRLHVINTVSGSTWGIWPPTRAAYTAGTALEIGDPVCLMNIVPDSRGFSHSQQYDSVTKVGVDFVEASWPSTSAYP